MGGGGGGKLLDIIVCRLQLFEVSIRKCNYHKKQSMRFSLSHLSPLNPGVPGTGQGHGNAGPPFSTE